jgi:hypothetical protein
MVDTKLIDDALAIFYSKVRDKILKDMVEEGVYADDYSKLSKMFGLEEATKGKMLGRSGKTYKLTATNHYPGEELGKYPLFKNIKYLTNAERQVFKVTVKNGELFVNGGNLAGRKGLIFVMDETGEIYAGTQQIGVFHHSSFLSGAQVATAGELKIADGVITLSAKSGHYQPEIESLKQVVDELTSRGVNMNNIVIDRSF